MSGRGNVGHAESPQEDTAMAQAPAGHDADTALPGLSPGRVPVSLPTISEYVDSLTNPYGLFRTLGTVEPETDAWGNVRFIAGGNAVVFRITANGSPLMLKCYIKPPLHSRAIYDWLGAHPDPLLPRARLLERELYVYNALGAGACYDVVVADWVEGVSLDTEIRRAAREYGKPGFRDLAAAFDDLAAQLLSREWAHGDLKPENIIATPDGGLKLVDYDAMFVPPLRGQATAELGTIPFQHPSRDESHYNETIDDYSVAVISVSLRALALDAGLFGRFNKGDNLLFNPRDILSGTSPAYDTVLALFAAHGDHASYLLALALRSPSAAIPGLADHFAAPYPFPDAVPGTAADVSMAYENPVPEPFEEGGLWGYRAPGGITPVTPVCSRVYAFSEGLGVICIGGCWQAVHTDGRIAFDCIGADALHPFSEGLAAFREGNHWGYVDKTGNVAVAPRFEMAGSMRQSRAVVRIAGKYGFIDRSGKTVIDAVYDYATGFRDSTAKVSIGDRELEIDLHGRSTGEQLP